LRHPDRANARPRWRAGRYHTAGTGGCASGVAGGENSLATTARGGGFVMRLTTTPATNDAAKAKISG
jgi:hypothetical protein